MMNMQQMLGEAGRTMSTPMRDTLVPQPQQPQRMPMSDNEPRMESTDTRMTNFLRKYAITPHLMDVGFFQEPSFDKWVEATRSANEAGSPIPYVAPILSDSIEALKVGYEAFSDEFSRSRQEANPQTAALAATQTMAQQQPMQPNRQPEEIQQILDSISI